MTETTSTLTALVIVSLFGICAGVYSIARDDWPQRFDTHFQDFTLRSER